MRQQLLRSGPIVLVALLVLLASAPALAQGGYVTTSLSGLVVDSSGAVIPGADVVVKNNAGGAEMRGVTDSTGRFVIPSINPGTYTVSVSLIGFKTAVLPDVQVVTATPASVRAVLELGEIQETVIVTGATEIVPLIAGSPTPESGGALPVWAVSLAARLPDAFPAGGLRLLHRTPTASAARPTSATADRITVRTPRRPTGPSPVRPDATRPGGCEPVAGVFSGEGCLTSGAMLRIRTPFFLHPRWLPMSGAAPGHQRPWSDHDSRKGSGEVESGVEAARSVATASATSRAAPGRFWIGPQRQPARYASASEAPARMAASSIAS